MKFLLKINSGFGSRFCRNKGVCRDYGYVRGGVTGYFGPTLKPKYLSDFADFLIASTAPTTEGYYARSGVVDLDDFKNKIKNKLSINRDRHRDKITYNFGLGGMRFGNLEAVD